MKEKKLKDRRTKARTLSIHTTRGEKLDYERAEWLATWPSPVLLKFKYEVKGHSNLFYYDITGLPTLKEYLGMGISRSQYVSLLRSLGRLGDLCSKANLPMEALRFEPENVYVSKDAMRFCCLPMAPVVQQMSVLALLALLADPSKVKFVLADDRELTERTMDFVRRSRVFSAFDFNEFLANNFGGGSGMADGQSSAAQDYSSKGHAQEAVFDPFAANAQHPAAGGRDAQDDGDARRQTPAPQPPSVQAHLNPPEAPAAPAGPPLPSDAQAAVGGGAQTRRHSSDADAVADSDCDLDEDTLPSLKFPTSARAQSPKPAGRSKVENHGANDIHSNQAKARKTALDSGTRALSGALRSSNPPIAGTASPHNAKSVNHNAKSVNHDAKSVNHGAKSGGRKPKGMGNQTAPADPGFSRQSPASLSFVVVRDSDGSRLCSATASVVIGRSKRCGARVAGNTNVSRVHASVTGLGGGRFIVSDLGSANGTTVAGRILHQGDQAEIGLGEHFSVADESLHLE